MHRIANTVVHLAFPLKQGTICPFHGVLMTLTVNDVNWLLESMGFSGTLEDEVHGLRGITYDQFPLYHWLPGEEFPNAGRGGAPFFVHREWVARGERHLIPGYEIPLQLHINHEHVFLAGESWPTGTQVITEKAPYGQFLEAKLPVATPENFPQAFRRLVAFDPRRAGEVLEPGGLEALGGVIRLPFEHLAANNLREMLTSEDVAVRNYAKSWLTRE